MGIDQSGDDPTAGEIDLVDPARRLESGARSNRFNLAAAHQYGCIVQGRSTGAVDQGGAYQRHTVLGAWFAGREKQATGKGASDESFSADHWMSDREGSSSPRIFAP
jgi:hypothetical protein